MVRGWSAGRAGSSGQAPARWASVGKSPSGAGEGVPEGGQRDGTWPDDRYFNDKIIKFIGLEPWQHRHLRPAFDLEHTDRVGPLDHVVGGLIFFLHGQIPHFVIVRFQKIEGAAPAPKAVEDRLRIIRNALRIVFEGRETFQACWTYIAARPGATS